MEKNDYSVLPNDASGNGFTISLHDEQEFQKTQLALQELEKQNRRNEEGLYKELEDYLCKLQNDLEKLRKEEENETIEQSNFENRLSLITEELEMLHLNIEELKEEGKAIEGIISLEMNRNQTLHSMFEETSIINNIYLTISNKDLTTIKKFNRLLGESSEENLVESIAMLRGVGGEYLKRQASVLYFLHLIKKRYIYTKIPKDISEDDIGNQNILGADPERIRLFQTKIRVIFGEESYLINLDTETKREQYTMKDLKEEACNIFNIPKEIRKQYNIVNDKLFVYSLRIKVWDIHKVALENNKNSLTWAHMELLDKMSIIMDRNTNINKDSNVSKLLVDHETNTSNLNRIKEGTFYSEIEEYFVMYVRWESLINFFKKDLELEKMNKEFVQIKKDLEEEKKKKKDECEYNPKKEENDEIKVENRYNEMIQNEESKHKERIKKHDHQPKPPIYMSQIHVHYLRLLKFWNLLFSIIMAVSCYMFQNMSGSIDIRESYDLNNFLKSVFIFNPMYKIFLRNQNAYTKTFAFEEIVRTKQDMMLWLDIIFNNLVMNNGLNNDNHAQEGIDTYNNFFQKSNTIYEILGGIKFECKLVQSAGSFPNTNYIKLGSNITSTFQVYDEYEIYKEETAPQPLNSFNIRNFTDPYDENICSKCFSKNKLPNLNLTNDIETEGNFADFSEGAYYLYMNNMIMNRTVFNEIYNVFRQSFILNSQLRQLRISFNALHVYHNTIIKFELMFEFSTIGDTQVSVTTDFLDTGSNESQFYEFLKIFIFFQMSLLSLSIVYRLFTTYLIRNITKLWSYTSIIYDILILTLFIFALYFGFQADYLVQTQIHENIFEKIKAGTTKNSSVVFNNTKNEYQYHDIGDILDLYNAYDLLAGIINLLLFFRILFYLSASPLISFIINLGMRTIVDIFNIILILTMFLLSYSLITHVMLGASVFQFSKFSRSLLLSFISLLGSMDTSQYGQLSTVQLTIIISLLIVIKFMLYTFLYAFIKETFDKLKKEYKAYRSTPHFKLVGDSVYQFFRYLVPIMNFYWMIKETIDLRKVFNINLELFVKEQFTANHLTYHKMIVEKRTVYFISKNESKKYKA